ncbi:thiamine pyrophosphate-dependent enzyme [Pontibacter sp. G13]|uniref:alpha-ketoacid dehydrogenase subunit alpha/beta n=1 Tax=Pontibacter sp. G13 TaxID=3074898 RepID=UPI00288B3F16|nr:thiamine pyrophosphate-dependent enzyme [Pontibacter sp. G13]WNJ19943.1 thiamine pyrophosphate-dependent enzyme [Pontibacter sp. G13]
MSVDSNLNLTDTIKDVLSPEEVLNDYRLVYESRQASLLGRREVLTGKAKFGIFGDGKELPQIAMAKVFQPGDIRSGYYRDQTFALATDISSLQQLFAQLYANPDVEAEPNSAGRQMNAHFASRNLDAQGNWKDLTKLYNSSPDASPTASQMPRLTGLAQASKLYREIPELEQLTQFSRGGNEVVFGTIGNASSAEGHFWESLNAIGVIQAPLVMSIWDDGYGISVPNEFQLTKTSLAEMLSGFQRTETERGFEIFQVKAWDYEALLEAYTAATNLARNEHVPSIIHVVEVTQPQGHSTSGSHERYKTKERLAWEVEMDCLTKFRQYVLDNELSTEEELAAMEKTARKTVRDAKNRAWKEFQDPIKAENEELATLILQAASVATEKQTLQELAAELKKTLEPSRREAMAVAHQALLLLRGVDAPEVDRIRKWRKEKKAAGEYRYDTYLLSESDLSPMKVEHVPAQYDAEPEMQPGFEILNRAFDSLFGRDPRVVAFGEDVGQLGDVNQGFKGLQEKYGINRVMDTGIREATIMGQAVGLALRGLRPIAEIQYLDYFIYGLQTLSDDLATILYRTAGGQKAPAIIRTRGHRLEGIWHAGSPLGMMIHALRGMHIAVPRNMTKAAGFYNTLMQGDDPAVVVEVLNGYRLREAVPTNLAEMTEPLGVPEVIREGSDVTIVTYGALCRIAMEAAEQLASCGIEVEIIDVQTLLPFDIHHKIVESLKKTNRILFLDEDVPGGATAYMMQQVLEVQEGYYHLDSEPRTLTAKAHRAAFGDDGDYWSKPQVADIFESVYGLMNEVDPVRFPDFL